MGSIPKNKHVPSLWFKLYARQPLVLNQDLHDFQNYIDVVGLNVRVKL